MRTFVSAVGRREGSSQSSMYGHFIQGGRKMPYVDCIWTVKYPLKVRMFIWLLEKDTTLTWPKL